MTTIQVILIAAFVLLLMKFLVTSGGSQVNAWKKIIGTLFVLFAIVAVLVPNALNRLAAALGVGRGADLLLYALTLTFIFVLFNSYITGKREQRRIVSLARKVAIIEAELKSKQ